MDNLNYILRAKKFRAKKSLGQNFLIDSDTIDFISSCAKEDDEILEIGAGLGFVTQELVKIAKNVVALEIDKSAINVLNKNLSSYDNFKLIEADILKTKINDLPFSDDKIKVIANIPYYITSPILLHLLGEIDDLNNENRIRIKELVLMVQLEVARRICADENSQNKEYGQLSILSQMYCDCEIVKIVPKKCFLPSPKVDSAIVRFSVKDEPKVEITRLLKRTVKAIFNQRRKNIKNSLLNAGFLGVNEALLKVNIEPNSRGEKLSVEKIQELSKALEEFN
ncbi:MAG: ribosomal RNA small subunit methyltransferase A [Candidatus Gastranaerophilales bacterium]|nr:ribosomal RNA small subunit methyltransferase A [Candidatus Gastranaerophilales bacterium]